MQRDESQLPQKGVRARAHIRGSGISGHAACLCVVLTLSRYPSMIFLWWAGLFSTPEQSAPEHGPIVLHRVHVIFMQPKALSAILHDQPPHSSSAGLNSRPAPLGLPSADNSVPSHRFCPRYCLFLQRINRHETDLNTDSQICFLTCA